LNEKRGHFTRTCWNTLMKNWRKFKKNPNNEDVVSKAPAMMDRTIVFEVVASHGCASQHKVGDKFYFDGSGNLLTRKSPKRICLSA